MNPTTTATDAAAARIVEKQSRLDDAATLPTPSLESQECWNCTQKRDELERLGLISKESEEARPAPLGKNVTGNDDLISSESDLNVEDSFMRTGDDDSSGRPSFSSEAGATPRRARIDPVALIHAGKSDDPTLASEEAEHMIAQD